MAKRKKDFNNHSNESPPYKRLRYLDHDEDKPMRYIWIYSHFLMSNYEKILKYSWIKSVKWNVKTYQYKYKNNENVLDYRDDAVLGLTSKAQKVIEFNYDYSLLQNSPNSSNTSNISNTPNTLNSSKLSKNPKHSKH